jgi:hypothetical protein
MVTIQDRLKAYKEDLQWKQQIFSLEVIDWIDELLKQIEFERVEEIKKIEMNCKVGLKERQEEYKALTGKEAFRGWNVDMVERQIKNYKELIALGADPKMAQGVQEVT